MAKDSKAAATTTAVQVALRIRPLSDRDRNQPRFANIANDDVLKIHDKTVQVVPQHKLFTFDHVFGTTSTQEEIFAALGDNLIRKFIEGYNITILAYGQTSSGKTYTMGTAAIGSGMNSLDEGIVPRSMALLFDLLNNNNNNNNNNDASSRPLSPTASISSSTSASTKSGSRLRPKSKKIVNRSSHIPHVNNNSSSVHHNNQQKTKFTVKVSFIEIYNEDLHDLLNAAPIDELPVITIREDTKGTIYWTGVKEVLVHSTDDVLYHLEQGTQNRATGATDMNEQSSRSHAIFSVSLKQEKWIPASPTTESANKKARPASSLSVRSTTPVSNSRLFNAAQNSQQEDGEWLITTSKFHFVDLAGSERLKRTAAEGDRRKEGININAGLLALGNVISALGDPSKKNAHVPYRDSKLTRLLQDSLGGSATTLMIACASPVEYNLAETLNTLQYANRARNIKNRSEKNQVEEWMTTENIELLRTIVGKLKHELACLKVHGNGTLTANQPHGSAAGGHEDMLDDVSSTSSSTTSPSLEDTYHEQRLLISDLQRQLEELDGEASVTRERNRIVEIELRRVRLLESVTRSSNKEEGEQVDFQYLVEPVIEEYEKSVAKLESQLSLTTAALHHSDTGYEEQQDKIGQLEGLIRAQEQKISELQSRLTKVLEREQSNDSYIQELESKLMKSANETTKDQEMLNELKNRIMKLKETDETTEQYITNLEQRLAAGEAERALLQTALEDLEAKIEAKERSNVELVKRLSKGTWDASTEKLILKELDQINAKYKALEGERDHLQLQMDQLQKESSSQSQIPAESMHHNNDTICYNGALQDQLVGSNKRLSNSSPLNTTNGHVSKNRKSFADETETASSAAASSLLQAEIRLKEEMDRANHLQLTLDRLRDDHQETVKELDEVLQRYCETSEQLDFMERESCLANAHNTQEHKSVDLSKEIAQAKENEHERAKLGFANQTQELEHRVQSLATTMTIRDSELGLAKDSIQRLEKDLAAAHRHITLLQQMENDPNEVDPIPANAHVLACTRNHDDDDDQQETLQGLLAFEKTQSSHWKLAHSELQQDMEKLVLDLDGKEQYIISQLEQEEKNTTCLMSQLDESNQQLTSLQKRLAETLASLTVLKLTHDGLQKKLQLVEKDAAAAAVAADADADAAAADADAMVTRVQMLDDSTIAQLGAKYTQEKSDLLDKHRSELAVIQHGNYLEQETHNARILQLTQHVEMSDTHVTTLQQELDLSKSNHQDALEAITAMKANSQQWMDRVSDLEQELEESKSFQGQLLADHENQVLEVSKDYESAIRELEDELEISKNLHKEIISSHSHSQHLLKQVQAQLDVQKADNVRLTAALLEQEQASIKQDQNSSSGSNSNSSSSSSSSSSTVLQEMQVQLDAHKEEKSHDANLSKLKDQHIQFVDSLQAKLIHCESENSRLKDALKEQQQTFKGYQQQQASKYEQFALQSRMAKTPLPAESMSLEQQTQKSSDCVSEKIALLESQLVTTPHPTHSTMSKTQVLTLQSQLLLQEEYNKNNALVAKLETLESLLNAEHVALLAGLNSQTPDSTNEAVQQSQRDLDHPVELLLPLSDHTQAQQLIDNNTTRELERLRIDFSIKEAQTQQLQEENSEYSLLSCELEKEMNRMTHQIEDLQFTQELVDQLLVMYKINDPHQLVDTITDERNRVAQAKSRLSSDHRSNQGSGATGQQGPSSFFSSSSSSSFLELEKQLNKCHQQISQMVNRDDMLKMQDTLKDEKKKYAQAERARLKLEKQMEELLSKKKLMCF